MATPFDEIKAVLTEAEAIPFFGPGVINPLNEQIPSDPPPPPVGGGGGTPPQAPEQLAFLQPAINNMYTAGTTVAGAVAGNAATVAGKVGEYAGVVQGFQEYIPEGGDAQLMGAIEAGQEEAGTQSARLQGTVTGIAGGIAAVATGYIALAGAEFGERSADALAAITTGSDAVFFNADAVAQELSGNSGTPAAVQEEFFEVIAAISNGQDVLSGSVTAGQAIVSGVADEIAMSGVPTELTELGQGIADGVVGVGNAVRMAGLELFGSGGGSFPPDASAVPSGVVAIAGTLSESAVGEEGVFTIAGGTVAGAIDGATETASAAVNTVQAIAQGVVLGGVEETVVPAVFSVPAAVLGELAGGDPNSPFMAIQGQIEENYPAFAEGLGMVTGTVSGGLDTAFGAIQGTVLPTAEAGATTAFTEVSDAALLVLSTATTTISSLEVPPGEFPPSGFPPGGFPPNPFGGD